MKKKIMLINCYREKADEKIEGYHGWLKAGRRRRAGAGCQDRQRP